MARVILVTGGCRSGKSAHALKLAESLPGRRAFLATCPVADEEMRQRILRHQRARAAANWQTLEEPVRLAEALASAEGVEVVLVDCLTLWVSNLMYQAEQLGREMDEDAVAERSREVLSACHKRDGAVLFVTNEVGLGVVPENALGRRFRDLVGRCNQTIAAGADTVTLVTCGVPLTLKGE